MERACTCARVNQAVPLDTRNCSTAQANLGARQQLGRENAHLLVNSDGIDPPWDRKNQTAFSTDSIFLERLFLSLPAI
eukprot:3346434-Pleurochrysis_carterae.AAC.3